MFLILSLRLVAAPVLCPFYGGIPQIVRVQFVATSSASILFSTHSKEALVLSRPLELFLSWSPVMSICQIQWVNSLPFLT